MSEGQGQGSGQGQGQGTGAGAGTGANGSGAGAGGQGGGDWRASLPAEIRDHGTIKNYKSVEDFAKGHIELNGRFSSRKMQDMDVPTDDAGKQAVFAKLGHVRPAKAEEYGLKFPDGYKGERNEAGLKDFTADAFEAGLTKDQAEKIMAKNLQRAEAQEEKAKQLRTDAAKRTEDHFRKTWGDKYDENKGLAEKAWAENVSDPKLREAFEQLGVNMNPVMVEIFAKIGRISQEGYMWSGTGNGGGAGTGDLAGKRAALAKYESENKAFILSQNDLNPETKQKKAEWRKLQDSVFESEIAAEKQGGA